MILFTLSFTLGIWLLQQQAALPDFIWAWLLIVLPLSLLIPQQNLALRITRALFIAVLACGLGFYHAAWQGQQRLSVSLPDAWQGQDIEVIGVVAELPRHGERGQRFAFDVEKTLTTPVTVPPRIYLSTYANPKFPPPNVHAGERWQFTVRLKQPHGSSNPYGADFELWALENHIRAVGYVHNKGNNIQLDTRAAGLLYRIESWREAVRDKINATLSNAPYAGVLSALTVGDQGSIPQSQWQVFRRTGVIHLMSISGLHITMLASMGFSLTYGLWRRNTRLTLWLPARKAAGVIALLVALAYALLSGYGVPAQRTVYMLASVAAALWLNRRFALTQILSFALLGVLIPDPWAVLSPGFWLSFGAVALILLVTAHRLRETDSSGLSLATAQPLRKLRGLLREYATVQWAMSIGLVPLLLGLFGQVSLVSPLANAFAIPLISLVVVPLALLGAILPSEIPLWLAHIFLDNTMILLNFLSELPQAVWLQHAPSAWSVVAGMTGVLWLLMPGGFPARWLGILLMLPMFLNTPALPATGSLRLIVFDVGQGLSVAALTRQHALLYDTGPDFSDEADSGNRILLPSLRGMGISELDGLIVSHDDLDHSGGTASVLQAMPVSWVSSSHPVPAFIEQPYQGCQDGTSWNWDDVNFEILHPGRDAPSHSKPHDNEQSCVLRISIGDQHILLAGDIEKHSEQRLLKEHAEQLSANLLVVPHHGSLSSSDVDFIAAVLPDYAVFTVGYRNQFNHPRSEIQQRYLDSGATLLRSDRDGAILVSMNAQYLTIERYRQTHRRYWTHQFTAD